MSSNILLCGVGGQGTVLASKLIAAAAVEKNYEVMSAETIGMAQTGGSVFSFLRIGSSLYSPMFGKGSADIIIAFEPAEAVRMAEYLKDGGTVIVNTRPIMPVTASLGGFDYKAEKMLDYLEKTAAQLTRIDCKKACDALGSPRVTNTVLLGAAVQSGALPFTMAEIESVMLKAVKPQFRELNTRALHYCEYAGQ